MPRLCRPASPSSNSLPPLTDEEVRACERKFGVRFPAALIELLKEENGGYFENRDFKLKGKDLRIADISGLSSTAEWSIIQPLSNLLDPDYFMEEELDEIKEVLGDFERIFPFSGDGHFFYALDYNRPNEAGEPKVIHLDIEGSVSREEVADTFAEFLAGQYEGDPEPVVKLEEAEELEVLVRGGFKGMRSVTGSAMEHEWVIGASTESVIVLAREDHGMGATVGSPGTELEFAL